MTPPLIMLVDDEVPFVETMTKRLAKRDLNVISAFSGQEALETIDKHRNVDVVVLDVKMPGMDGIETLKKLKTAYPLTEVVMLTAHAFSIESLKESLDLGAPAYLPKEKMADIVSFLEDVVTMEHKENWQRLFKRLGGLLNATFGADWNKELIEIGPFIVPE